jgi:hypothetical protein
MGLEVDGLTDILVTAAAHVPAVSRIADTATAHAALRPEAERVALAAMRDVTLQVNALVLAHGLPAGTGEDTRARLTRLLGKTRAATGTAVDNVSLEIRAPLLTTRGHAPLARLALLPLLLVLAFFLAPDPLTGFRHAGARTSIGVATLLASHTLRRERTCREHRSDKTGHHGAAW